MHIDNANCNYESFGVVYKKLNNYFFKKKYILSSRNCYHVIAYLF